MKLISKNGKNLMLAVIICTFIIFFNSLIPIVKLFANTLNLGLVVLITIFSIILCLKERKDKQNNIDMYIGYICGGALYILIGSTIFTPLLFAGATLSCASTNKTYNKLNNLETKNDNLLIFLSASFFILFLLAFASTFLFSL